MAPAIINREPQRLSTVQAGDRAETATAYSDTIWLAVVVGCHPLRWQRLWRRQRVLSAVKKTAASGNHWLERAADRKGVEPRRDWSPDQLASWRPEAQPP
jgi:hypothetical protein